MVLTDNLPQQQRRSRSRSRVGTTTVSNTTTKTTSSNKLQFLVLGAAEAGKTSIIRRYFHNQFDNNRLPTLGSDYYTSNQTITIQQIPSTLSTTNGTSPTGTLSSSSDNDDNQNVIENTIDIDDENDTTNQDDSTITNMTTTINLRVWDTPGRERYRVNTTTGANNTNPNNRPSSLSESFFTNIDGILLVYDMTSSTSFQQLLKWYADIIHIYQRKNSSINITNDSPSQQLHQQQQHPPILICANKLDLFEQRFNNSAASLSNVPTTTTKTTISTKGNTTGCTANATTNRRNVFTFQRNFRGHDFQYEYQVCHDGYSSSNVTGGTKSLTTSKRTQNNTNNNNKAVLKHFINKLGFIESTSTNTRSQNCIDEVVENNMLNSTSSTCTATTTTTSTTSSLSTTTPSSPESNSSSTSTPSSSNSRSTTGRQQHSKQHMELLTYLANRESKWWTNNDYTYLESLVLSEDLSHPDRELVVLWCKRNYLYHSDVSAATGYGINTTFNQLIQLSIMYKKQQNEILYEQQQKLERERQQQQLLQEQQQQYIIMQLAQSQQHLFYQPQSQQQQQEKQEQEQQYTVPSNNDDSQVDGGRTRISIENENSFFPMSDTGSTLQQNNNECIPIDTVITSTDIDNADYITSLTGYSNTNNQNYQQQQQETVEEEQPQPQNETTTTTIVDGHEMNYYTNDKEDFIKKKKSSSNFCCFLFNPSKLSLSSMQQQQQNQQLFTAK